MNEPRNSGPNCVGDEIMIRLEEGLGGKSIMGLTKPAEIENLKGLSERASIANW